MTIKSSDISPRLNPLPNERMDAHSNPISNEELDGLIEWCWDVATATWEKPTNDAEVRVVNDSWFRKWKALKELQTFRGGSNGANSIL